MKKRRVLSLFLASTLAASLIVPVAADDNSITATYQVPEGAWYSDAAEYVLTEGLMSSTVDSETLFDGEANSDRGTLFEALYILSGSPAITYPASFDDVDGTDYAESAAWAEQSGLTVGIGGGLYAGDRSITRAEVATVLGRLGIDAESGDLSVFLDTADVPDWALDGMYVSVGSGLIQGTSAGALNPNGYVTRAELATILYNMVDTTTEEEVADVVEEVILPSGYAKGWTENVETALNDFILLYGEDSANYDATNKPYVVFDFDNTTSIFDIQEQASVYMLNYMNFEIDPEDAFDVFMTEVPVDTVVGSDSGYLLSGEDSGLTFEMWAEDCAAAYAKLYEKYPISAEGIHDEAILAELYADPDWQEFSAKMRSMYDVIYDNLSASIAYPWVLYWFTGMTEQEAYDVLYASHTTFGAQDFEWHKETYTSPEDYASNVGPVTYTWTYGITVADETKELWEDLYNAGFDIYVCSASMTDTIRAAVDAFGLDEYISGVIAMTIQLDENGVYTNSYDYETGYSWWHVDGQWVKGDVAIEAQTQGIGKVTAITNVLVDKYGYGPVAGFMDSTGDFNFCTEFASLKLVLNMNRLRKPTDGGGIIQVVAMKQEADGIDLQTANAAGDILYVVNGRDENGGYIIQEQGCVTLGGSYSLYKNSDLEALYNWYSASDLTVEEFINTFALSTSASDESNEVAISYGFLSTYAGYKNIQ